MAVDADHVYWGNAGTNTIGRADITGGDADQNFITGAAGPANVTVDAHHVYWANAFANTIGRADITGADVDQSFITGATAPRGVAVTGAVITINDSVWSPSAQLSIYATGMQLVPRSDRSIIPPRTTRQGQLSAASAMHSSTASGVAAPWRQGPRGAGGAAAPSPPPTGIPRNGRAAPR